MIASKYLFTPELKTKFNVLKVDYNPHAESTWFLEYKGHGPIKCDEIFETVSEDQQLIGKEIEAQINIEEAELLTTNEKIKSMSFRGNLIKATGIYEDNVVDEDGTFNGEMVLDSLFKLNVSGCNLNNLTIGDWLTVEGEARLILPCGRNAFGPEECAAQKHGGIAEDYIAKVIASYNEIERCEEQINWVEHIATGKKYDLRTWRHYDHSKSRK